MFKYQQKAGVEAIGKLSLNFLGIKLLSLIPKN